MNKGNSQHAHVQAHCASASEPPRTFDDINTGLGALLPDYQERNLQRGQQTAQMGQYSGTTKKVAQTGQSSGTTHQEAQKGQSTL